MIASKAVVAAALLMAVLDAVSARPRPSIIRERHIIHAPIKFRVIHHYKIHKVPVVIKKHLHYHKSLIEKTKPLLEEIHVNHIQEDDSNGHSAHPELLLQGDSNGHSAHPQLLLQGDSKTFSSHDFRQQSDDDEGFSTHSDFHQRGPRHQSDHDSQEEEDYDDDRQSQEDYDDYEYE